MKAKKHRYLVVGQKMVDMIRASAADDRTREITAKLREGLGPYVPDAPFLSQREIADLIEQAFPDAFPKPGGAP